MTHLPVEICGCVTFDDEDFADTLSSLEENKQAFKI